MSSPQPMGPGAWDPRLQHPPAADPLGHLVALAHATLLGRAPSPAEQTHWAGLVGGGQLDAEGLMRALLEGPEFQALPEAGSDHGFVAMIWENLTGEAPDALLVQHWTDLLAAHVLDRAEMALALGLGLTPEQAGHGGMA